jgi:hypothetical protein
MLNGSSVRVPRGHFGIMQINRPEIHKNRYGRLLLGACERGQWTSYQVQRDKQTWIRF